MLVEENGKRYNIDEQTGLVTEANVIESDEEIVNLDKEIRLHSRVEAEGELGEVVSITPSVYGLAYGVLFDGGDIDEYPEEQLKLTTEEAPDYEAPINEVAARFASYEKLPTFTNDELAAKETEARWLNLRSKSLVTDAKLPLSDQNELGRVVLVTGTDLMTIKELREQSEDTQDYLNRFPRYQIDTEVHGGAVMGAKGDTSWLADALDGMEVVETTDADLAARATEVVAAFSKSQLENDEFMGLAASYHREYLQMTDAQAEAFDSMLTHARQERLKEIPTEKTASADDDNLDNFDASAIFL